MTALDQTRRRDVAREGVGRVGIQIGAFLGALNGTAGSDKYDTTYRLKLKNGTYNWFRATGGVVRDKLGKPRRASPLSAISARRPRRCS